MNVYLLLVTKLQLCLSHRALGMMLYFNQGSQCSQSLIKLIKYFYKGEPSISDQNTNVSISYAHDIVSIGHLTRYRLAN